MDAEIAGLVGALVGAFVSIATTYLSNTHALKLQSAADDNERQEKARAFQRENLLACQEMMQIVARLTARAFHEDYMALKTGTPWGKNRLTEQLDEDLATNLRQLSILIERISEEDLRNQLKAVKAQFADVPFAGSVQASENRFNASIAAHDNAMELLGAVLRKSY